jgi:hypothetical protein
VRIFFVNFLISAILLKVSRIGRRIAKNKVPFDGEKLLKKLGLINRRITCMAVLSTLLALYKLSICFELKHMHKEARKMQHQKEGKSHHGRKHHGGRHGGGHCAVGMFVVFFITLLTLTYLVKKAISLKKAQLTQEVAP